METDRKNNQNWSLTLNDNRMDRPVNRCWQTRPLCPPLSRRRWPWDDQEEMASAPATGCWSGNR